MNIEKVIREMTLREKILFCTGADMWHTKAIDRLGIGQVTMADGPHGMRFQGDKTGIAGMNDSSPATCFPSAVTAGATWDTELISKEGEGIGKEAHDLGVDIVLGPGCNIKRNPLCGRNFEYFSEDPYLSGKLAAAFVKGQQSATVSSCIKHFAANNQETSRLTSNSCVDDRALREIYLAPFETVVKEARPDTLMCSYNKINGTYSSDNKRLLTDILRDEWGFSGLVMSDWGAMNDRIAAFSAGCDLNMPGGSVYMLNKTEQAVKDGTLSEERINDSVRRILKVYEKNVEKDDMTKACFNTHHDLSCRIAEDGAVLLKNEGLLPLKTKDIALFGHMCEETRHQGAGSSHINPTKLYNICDTFRDNTYFACCDIDGVCTEKSLERAAHIAKQHEIAVVVAGLPESYESEGFDRENMRMPQGHVDMINAVSSANPNTVVVLLGGSPMECDWISKVSAVLYMGLPGQAAGEALKKLLYGYVNPSGKLTETWARCYDDVISKDTFGNEKTCYKESVFVGYRYYETADVPVRFPFGYGLSYSTFRYDNIKISGYSVSVDIENTSDTAGAEVVQMYVMPPFGSVFRPVKELKGFCKVFLSPHEKKTVTFELGFRSFAIWQGRWVIPDGSYTIAIGSSVRDIRQSATVYVKGDKDIIAASGTWYDKPTKLTPTDEEFEKMSGISTAPEKKPVKGEYDMNCSCTYMKKTSFVMRFQYALTKLLVGMRVKGKHDFSNPEYRMMLTSATECPMRTVVISSCGAVKENVARGLLLMANGHFFKGIWEMIIGNR